MLSHSKSVLSQAIGRHWCEALESRRLLSGATVYVNAAASPGGNGQSWSQAFTDLTTGLNSVSGTNNLVKVAAGTYTPGTAVTSTFNLRPGVDVQGGYTGGTGSNADTRLGTNITILSGALTGGLHAQHVVTVATNADSTAILEGFTITLGQANGTSTAGEGGGIFTASSVVGSTTFVGTPEILDCIITGNSAKAGGGMFNLSNGSSSPTNVINCLFTQNIATGGIIINGAPSGGGGIESVNGQLSVANCTFSGNIAIGGRGAGLDVNTTLLASNVINSIFWGDNGPEIIPNPSTMSGLPPVAVSDSDVSGGYTVGNTILNTDPKFTSSTDFHLQSSSPCVNSIGQNNGVPQTLTTDLDFNPRIVNTTIDLGPYEVQASSSVPTLIYVDQNAPDTLQNGATLGSSWTDAYHSLQTAIGLSGNGTTIEVAQGTYLPSTTGTATDTFQLKSGVTMKGGYFGYNGIGGGIQDNRSGTTTLSGAITNNPGLNNTGYSYHVLTTTGADSTAKLDGFSIIDGSASGAGTNGDGGGLFNSGGSPTISDCVFSNNYANFNGGAVYSTGAGSLTLTACVFNLNSTASAGGGVFSDATAITISLSVFGQSGVGGNTANNGGGLYLEAGTANLSNVTVNYNSATGDGGAIECGGANITMFNVSCTQNSAALGGAMDLQSGSTTATNCTFDGNTAGVNNTMGQGGAISNEITASAKFIQCIFVGNTATGTAGDGGAIFSNGSSVHTTLVNCALTSNKANDGGAVYNISSTVSISNTILWNDSAIVQFPEIDSGTGTVSQTTNDTADPVFFRNPSSGADHTWGTSDDDYGDLRVQAASPCLDAGTNLAFSNVTGINYDFTVVHSRLIDYPGAGATSGAIIDIGPYEAQVPLTITGQAFELNNNPADVKFTFSLAVSAPGVSAVTIDPVNADGSLDTAHPVTAASATYNAGTTTVTFALPISMPDGNYRATLAPGSVTDTSANPNPLLSSASVNFFILRGDANQDRIVNALDFNQLATNYGQPGNFTQGDFDYSGVVGSGDFDLLAARFGKMLAAPAMSQPVEDIALSSAPATSLFSDSKINDDATSDVLV